MASALTSASGQETSFNAQLTVHVRSIEVNFKRERNKYPVSIKASFGVSKPDKSRHYKKDESIHWLCERKVAPDAQLKIIVREHRTVRRSDKIVACVAVSELITKPFFEVGAENNAISLKIHSSAGGPFIDLVRRLVEQSQVRLEAMGTFLEKLGRVCEALDYALTLTDIVSSVHPAVESAASVASSLLELCQKLQECHSLASELMEELATFLPFTDIPERGLKCKVTAQTTNEMLVLFERVCRAIIKYSNGSVLGSLLDDRIEEICSFKDKIRRLKETFRWCLTTEVWKTTLKIEENTDALLLRELDPLSKACYNENKLCFEGSRKDTLRAVEEWSESQSSPRLFWLYGHGSLGKTAIANTVARLFHGQNRLAGCFSPDGVQTSNRIMPTIAYHLAAWHADYQDHILDVLRGPQRTSFASGLGNQFEHLIRQPMTKINFRSPPAHKPLIIVLDALENCHDSEDSMRSFVDYIMDIAILVPWLKIFISSRMSENLSLRFHCDVVQHFPLDSPVLDFQHDFAACAILSTESRRSFKLWTTGKKRAAGQIFSRIAGSLQALNAIEDIGTLEPAIRSLDIGEFFRAPIKSVMERKGLSDEDIPAIRDVFAVMCRIAPIKAPTEDVLLHFLWLIRPDISQDYLHRVIDSLSPIIYSTKGQALQILFPPTILSVFLSNERESGHFYMNMASLKCRLAQLCFDALFAQLKFNICSLEDPRLESRDVPDTAERVDASISGMLRCSSLYGMDLLAQTDNARSRRALIGNLLCSRKALFWVEVLSLLGELDAGKDILSRCADQFKGEARIFTAATELRTFISNFEAIKHSVPHLYISALTWLSPDSPIMSGRRNVSIVFERLTDPATNAARIESERDIYCITRSPDGTRVVSGDWNGKLYFWDGWTGERIGEPIKGHSDRINDIEFSSDGIRFVSGSLDKAVKIWDAQTRKVVNEMKSVSVVYSVGYSPGRRRVVSGHQDGSLRVWDAENGTLITESRGRHNHWVWSVAYSQDGRRIVSGSFDGTLRIWDAESGAAVVREPPEGHHDTVTSVAYSPDGSRIVSGSRDKTIRIWNAHKGGAPASEALKGHEDSVVDAAYSQTGDTIISASQDRKIRFWDAADGALIGVLCLGESRWDPARGQFVSVPKWWPGGQLGIQALIYTANPIYIPNDGWIRTLDGGLLLYVPPEHRACSCHTAWESPMTMGPRYERFANSAWKHVPRWADVKRIMAENETDRG